MPLYDPATPGGARLSQAVAKYREAIADLNLLRTSTLEKAYADRPGNTGEPVFTRMVEEYGVASGTIGNQVYTQISAIVISAGNGQANGDGEIAAGAARFGALLLDLFA